MRNLGAQIWLYSASQNSLKPKTATLISVKACEDRSAVKHCVQMRLTVSIIGR